MKKIFYLNLFILIFFAFILNINTIEAKYETTDVDDETLLARCVYKNSEGGLLKLFIAKKYEITLQYMDDYSEPGSYHTVEHNIILTYNDMLDSENNLTCKKKIYVSSVTGMVNNRQAKTSYQIQPTDKKRGSLGETITEYTLDGDNTKIYNENIDKEEVDDSKWLKICHYGSYYLKFNKDEYETNITNLTEAGVINSKGLDVMDFLTDNNYSCPTSLCSSSQCAGGYCATFRYFDMKFNNLCIVSKDFVSEYSCGSLQYYMTEIEKIKDTSDVNSKINLQKHVETIQIFCNSVLQHLDYDDPTNCVKECLKIQDYVVTELNLGNGQQCGFSEKLILWIANIVKWAKYLIPVIVIVLGILDFIKAISSEKEDEMKKAQAGFVKRLIACALIFIIPFIIEFVLNKMGFDANGCGIIDL